MPGACPTWTKRVGQAHLARCLLQEALLLESGLCSYRGSAGSLSSSRKKSFPGGPAGKHLITLDSLLSSSVQDGGLCLGSERHCCWWYWWTSHNSEGQIHNKFWLNHSQLKKTGNKDFNLDTLLYLTTKGNISAHLSALYMERHLRYLSFITNITIEKQ